MFTGMIDVKRLSKGDFAHKAHWIEDINFLLRKQKNDARPVTSESLAKSLGDMVVVIAINDRDRVIGIGVLRPTGGLNFDCAEIRHLVVLDDSNLLTVGTRIVQALREFDLHACEFIDAGGWLQDKGFTDVLVGLGFKPKPDSRFRLYL